MLMHFIIQRQQSLFLFLLISVNQVYSQCEMGILLKGWRSFYNFPIGHLHDDAISLIPPETVRVFAFFCKLELWLFKLCSDYQIYKNEKNIEWRNCVNDL